MYDKGILKKLESSGSEKRVTRRGAMITLNVKGMTGSGKFKTYSKRSSKIVREVKYDKN